ncbi:hypothetical protein BGZ52_003445 [Haplosporangium bisporale]|nr:hypothetical protein BGZ52_003445 [Haplosporangium bisporale]KFH72292.1 hypothetical protein MVEG_02583 [Podila verticillata NRRL 6337]
MTNNGTTPLPNETEDMSLASSPTLTDDSYSPSRPTFGRALSSDLTVIQNTLTLTAPIPYPIISTSSAPKETHHTLQPPHAHEHKHEHDPEHHHIHLHDLVPESPIDGGLKGWLAVLGSFLIHCFAFAPTEFIFGIFELHYHNVFPDATSSSIAFVGTTGSAVTYIAGFLSGIVADRFGFRGTALCGTIVMTISLVLASFSTKIWHLYMTQGVLFGIGASMIYYPGVAVPSQYFNRRRGLAMGIAVSGAGAGGFVLAPLTNALIDRVEVFWTLRILALMIFVVCGIASLLISERKENPPTSTTPYDGEKVQDQEQGHKKVQDQEHGQIIIKSAPMSDESEDASVTKNEITITASQEQGKQLSHEVQKPFDKVRDGDKGTVLDPTTEPKAKKPSFFESFHVLKDPRFMSLTLAELTASIGYLIPYYYMQTYAVFIGLTPEQGALILGLTNGAAFAGRIVLGLLADRFSNSVIMLISTWSTAISVVVFWSIAKSFATLTIMGMSFGFFVGAYVSLVPVAVAESFGTQQIASMIGLMYGAGGIAMWGGSPLAGHILEMTKPNLSYKPVIATAGASLVLGAMCCTSWAYFHRRAVQRAQVSRVDTSLTLR